MKSALDVHRELLARDVPHEMLRLRDRASTADDLPRLLGVTSGCVAVRCYEVVRDDRSDGFAAVLVPAGTLPQPGALLEALGACAVRPARPDVVNARTDYVAGLVGPVCLPADVELLADSALAGDEVSYCAVGEAQVVLGIRTRHLLVVTGAREASLRPGSRAGDLLEVLDLDREAGVRTAG